MSFSDLFDAVTKIKDAAPGAFDELVSEGKSAARSLQGATTRHPSLVVRWRCVDGAPSDVIACVREGAELPERGEDEIDVIYEPR